VNITPPAIVLETLLATQGPVLPVVLPLIAGALLVLMESARSRSVQRWVPWMSAAATFALAVLSLLLVQRAGSGNVQAYLVGNWPAPFGIALALDRLGALMVLLTALVGCGALVYALGGVAARGLHFHALFQFQLMGLNGAFLTADLFNLFVFFEVLLAASYGLLLHGRGAGQRQRLQAGVHYVTFNLAGSSLFLIALGLLYGVAGTLNMADLVSKLATLPAGDMRLAQAAALLLLTVFAVKAALLPLYFWLPDTYAAATAPVGALFAIMTKVGVYAVLRVTTLVFGAEVAAPFLSMLALATVALAAVGALAAGRLRGLVAYLVVASAGTLLLAAGLGTEGTLAAGLFYLVNSTLAAAAWFLLADRIAAARGGSDLLQARPLGGHWAALGAAFFVAAVAVAGVPPLAGFMGKALLLQAAGPLPFGRWVVAGVLASSLAVMVALARAGSVIFWKSGHAGTAATDPSPAHPAAIVALLTAVLAVTGAAGPVSAYTSAAARQLLQRQAYVDAVMGARQAPAARDLRKEMRERGELR
jgi:multicomponent K+:H+ antiporter subunit D